MRHLLERIARLFADGKGASSQEPRSIMEVADLSTQEGSGWNAHGGRQADIDTGIALESDEAYLSRLRESANRAYRRNPHAHGIVENLTNFIVGKGAELVLSATLSDAEQAQVREEWGRFKRANKWRRAQQEIVRRAIRDGECFLRFTIDRGDCLSFHFLEPDWITSLSPDISHGIETDPNDVGQVKSYRLVPPLSCSNNASANLPLAQAGSFPNASTQREVVLSPKEVQHIRLNVDSNVKRGRSYLEPVLRDLEDLAQFRRYRTTLNKARTAVVMVRKVAGAGSQGRRLSAQAGMEPQRAPGIPGTTGRSLKPPKAGTVYTIDKESEVEFKSPNLGASEAAHDGRMLTLAIAAGVGLPEFVLSADASNNNFASVKQATLTLIKLTEDMHAFFGEEFCEIFDRVIAQAKLQGRLRQDLDVSCDFEFPAFDIRDLSQDAHTFAILRAEGVVSKASMAARFGYDYEEEIKKMKREETL